MNLYFFNLDAKEIFLSVVGLIIGWVISRHYRTVNRRELSYTYDYDRLLPKASRADGFKFLYNDRSLNNPIKLSLSIWNSGTDFLDRDDFAESPAIEFHFEGYQILAAQIAKESRPANKFAIVETNRDHSIALDVKFINPHEGVKVEVFLDRADDQNFNFYSDVKIAAVVKGATSDPQHSYSFSTYPSNRSKILYSLFLVALFGQIALMAADLYQNGFLSVFAIPKLIALVAFGLIGFLMLVIPLSDMPQKGREYPEDLRS